LGKNYIFVICFRYRLSAIVAAAQGIAAESPQPGRPGPGEDLQRKARFFAAKPQKMRPNSEL
jgi:hypothetical protein